MTPADFRRLALALPGAEQGSHMGVTDFRVGGRIFATLASADRNLGNLMLDPESQTACLDEVPELYLPVAGGWGRMGATHIRLERADEMTLQAALHTAWKLRVTKNEAGTKKSRVAKSLPRSAKVR